MLAKTLSSSIDAAVLYAIVPRLTGTAGQRQRAIIGALAASLPALLDRFGVTTAGRIAHLLAQVAHESDNFQAVEEYASGKAYEGRKDLGNDFAGDGSRFKGRGPIQLTGRSNYRAFTLWMRQVAPACADFEARPELVAEFPWAAWSVFYFWSTRNINLIADRDDLVAVTRIINGGRNGLDDRREKLGRAKTAVAAIAAQMLADRQDTGTLVLRRGSEGADVDQLQRALASAGHYLMAIDGDFGPATEAAVRTFQRSRGLTVDGIAGAKTLETLKPYETKEHAK